VPGEFLNVEAGTRWHHGLTMFEHEDGTVIPTRVMGRFGLDLHRWRAHERLGILSLWRLTLELCVSFDHYDPTKPTLPVLGGS
jgi:hypothetical protein